MARIPKAPHSLLLLLLLLLAPFAGLQAQSVRGEMAGNITDPNGAVIPGATITAVNQSTGGKSVATSTSSGGYRFPDLPLGTYNVTVTAPGFSAATNTGVLVQVNTTASLDVKLTPGAVNETITVDASGLRIQTESSEIGGTVSTKQIEDLPLSLASGVGGLRSPETFVFLLPGTTGPGSGTSGNTGNGVFFARISGGQAYGAETLLDGASIQRSENGSSFDETSPSIEALQEFKVTTSTPSAEFGRTTAGIESFSTKSGGNAFHGLAYAIVKNRVFDANNWFNNGYIVQDCQGKTEVECTYSKPQDSKYDFGGTFSGPVRIPHLYNGKDRSFFEFAWEKYQLHLGGVINSTVPTAAERTGNFSDLVGIGASAANPTLGPGLGVPAPGNTPLPGYPAYSVLVNPCNNQVVTYNQIYDPTTSRQVSPGVFCRTPLPGNQIPTSYLSSTATKLLAGLPLPNQAPQTTNAYGITNNYSFSAAAPNTNTTYTIRIDQNISDRSKIFASYDTRQNFKLTGQPDFPEPFNNNGYVQTFTTHYSRAGWDFTITPNILNHVNVGYNRTNSVNLSSTLDTTQTAAKAGLPGDYSVFFPIINFPSPQAPSSWGQQQNGDNIDNGIRLNDNISWLKGRNSFKFGVDVRFQQYSVIQYNVDSFNFYRDQSSGISNTCCFAGNPFASFLMGQVGYANQTVYNEHPRWNSHYIGGFFEDDVKVSNNLTLNLGVRYDVDTPRKEALNRTSNFSTTAPDPEAGNIPGALVFGTTCNCNTRWADTWYKDIAPRLGFAYVLPGTNNRAVLRGGGAILYGPLQYSDFGGGMSQGFTQFKQFSLGQTATTGGAFSPAFRLDSMSPADPTNPNVGFPSTSYAASTDPGLFTAPDGPGSFEQVPGSLITGSDGRPAMVNNWSLQLQDELAQDLIFTIGYIGQAAQNLHSGDISNYNNISPSQFNLGDRLNNPQFFIPLGGANSGVKAPYSTFEGNLGQALRPFPQYDYIQGDCCLENFGHSSYEAMVVSLERRFRNGFNLQASYTWSKDLTDADSLLGGSAVSANEEEQGQGQANLKLDKTISAQNLTNQFSLSYLYQLPFGKGRKFLNNNRALDLIVGGWQVGAIQRYSSGQPVAFGCASPIPYYQNCIEYTAGPASNNAHSFASAAYLKDKNGPSAFNGESWFKPAYRLSNAPNGAVPLSEAAFVDQNLEGPVGIGAPRPFSPGCGSTANPCSFVPYSLGNLPRETDAITGPLYKAEDISLLKDFHLTERTTFQLKGEAFDLFNRHRMGLPDFQPGDSNQYAGFGTPGGVDYGPRNMQVTGRFTF